MLALKGYEQNEGFSVISTEEMLEINGGSGSKEEGPFIEVDPEDQSVSIGYRHMK